MGLKRRLSRFNQGWLPKDPTVSVTNTPSGVEVGKWLGEKAHRVRNFLLLDIVATFIAALLVGLTKGYNESLLVLFLGFLSAMVITRILGPNRGYKQLQERQRERMIKFRERLSSEGVIDETTDIARAGRIVWWISVQKRSEMLSRQVEDFGKVKRNSGKIYVIDRQTLSKLAEKLPIKDEELNRLTPPEQRIFNVLRTTGDISLEEKEFRLSPFNS
jgi:hypothetical protein